jgi:sec-independent protein translocase protein TatA
MNLGAPEILLLIIGAMLLFGYKKLPDASRSIGRSLRIFKGEMKGMKEEDDPHDDRPTTTPVRGDLVTPLAVSADGLSMQLLEEARLAEDRAAALRARADQARTTEGTS